MHFHALRSESGFTLMELMLVVAIIGIIAVLAIPTYLDYAVRAKVGESLAVAAAAKTATSEACQTNPLVAPTNATVGYSYTPSNYVQSVVVGGTCTAPTVTVTTKNVGASPAPVILITGSYAQDAGRYNWICSLTTGNNNQVPSTCRGT